MTWPPIIRVFFAVELNQDTQTVLNKTILSLKKNTKIKHISWTRPENFHITLKFIPTLKSADLTLLEEKALKVIQQYTSPLLLHIEHCITFPPFYHPRIIAMEVTPITILKPIADSLSTLSHELHLPSRDEHPFRPHITLGRIKHPNKISVNDITSSIMPLISPIPVQHITLFRSEPSESGSCYTVIKRFPLG